MVIVRRLAIAAIMLCATIAAQSASPLIEEIASESDRDDLSPESFSTSEDLLNDGESELRSLPVLSAAQVERWLLLRSNLSDVEWTWQSFADSLHLTPDQLVLIQEIATLREGRKEKGLIRLTVAGDTESNVTGMTAKFRARHFIANGNRTEILAVRRTDDPRVIDDLHVSLSGDVKNRRLYYWAGTYQLDWGLGLLSSKGFGTARAFTSLESSAPEFGTGIGAQIPSSEHSWRRGAALEYRSRLSAMAGANAREWNARIEDDVAELTGTLQSGSSERLSERDRLGERSGFIAIRFAESGFEGGGLMETSEYDPELASSGEERSEGSVYAGMTRWGMSLKGEGARSDGKTAGCGSLTRGTERLVWALYSLYAEDGYSPLRGQGWRSYGATPEDLWRRGARAAWWGDAQRVFIEVRDETEADRARGEAELRWYCNWGDEGELHMRAVGGMREQGTGEPERHFERFRAEARWGEALRLTARAEIRQSRNNGGDDSQHGSYLYLQAERKQRRLDSGLRVTSFDLPSSESPALIYERDLVGAYPIQFLSGRGTRVAGWVMLKFGPLRLSAKGALTRREGGGRISEFGVEASLVR